MKKHAVTALLVACLCATACAFAAEVADGIAGSAITTSASPSYSGMTPQVLTNGAGMDDCFRHDNNPHAATMWHTQDNPAPSSPAQGVPASPAWVRLDFKEAQAVGACMIWNHNQQNLTNRGFRHTRAFVSADGKTFVPVKAGGRDVFEIPQAKGAGPEEASFTLRLPGTPVKSVILAAQDNWGGNVYGLSQVQVLGPVREAPAEKLPAPEKISVGGFPFLLDSTQGTWTREVTVKLGHPLHERIEASVTCEGATRIETIDPGLHGLSKLTLKLPEGKGILRSSTAKVSIVLKAAGSESKIETAIVAPEKWRNMEEVVVTYKTHLDIGFSHPLASLLKYYPAGMMDAALATIDKFDTRPADEQFKWMLPAWAMDLVYNHQPDPKRKARIKRRIEDGHLVWHAFPYTFEVDGSDAEEIVRGFHYSTNLSRQFGRPLLRSAKMTDAPSHSWLTPTLLKHAGIELLQIGSNYSNPDVPVPMMFWWEGPDGSRLLTLYSSRFAPGLGYGTSQTPPDDWSHKTWLDMEVTIDNSGPPSMAAVDAAVARIRQAIPGVRVRFGDMDDFLAKLEKEDLGDLKVVRTDMPDTWIHGIMSLPDATALHRHSAGALASWNQLEGSGAAWGLPATPQIDKKLEYAYDQAAYYSEHTWGLAGPGIVGEPPRFYGKRFKELFGSGAYRKYDEEFQVHGDYARRAMAEADKGIAEKLGALAQGVKVDGPRVVVFNPLPQTQSAQASVALPAGTQVSGVTDVRTGRAVPYAVTGSTLRLLAQDLPAGGYQTYALKPGAAQAATAPVALAAGNTLETAHFKATFDLERGGILSLVDKATGRELVDPSRHALGQFIHERFDHGQVLNYVHTYVENGGHHYHGAFDKQGMPPPKESPYLVRTPAHWTAQVARDALGLRVTLTAGDTLGLAEKYSESFSFPDAQACLDVAWTVTNKTPNPIPEGGWLCFPFKVGKPNFCVGRSGGPIDPAKDIISGTNRHMLTVDTGISVRNGGQSGAPGAGVALASDDLPLWSLGEPGLWKFSRDYVPATPELFANLYNNMWDTNFRPWQDGSWTSSVRVWPVANGENQERALITPSWQLRQGVLAAFGDGKAGNLPVAAAGLSLSRPGIRVMAYGPNPDSNASGTTLLRVWEQAGESGELTVTLPPGAAFTRATPVDLRGTKLGKAVKVENGKFIFALKAYEPASFVLE